MTTHDWNGHTIAVRVRLMPRFAWMVARFIVEVDGQPNASCKGRRKWPGAPLPFTLQHAGAGVPAALRPARFISMYSGITYSLQIGPDVFHGRAYAENHGMHTIPIALLVSASLASFTGMSVLWFLKLALHSHQPYMVIALNSGDPQYLLWSSAREFGVAVAAAAGSHRARTLLAADYWLALPAAALVPLFWLTLKYRGYRARKRELPDRGFPV